MSGIWAPAFVADAEKGDTIKLLKTRATANGLAVETLIGTLEHTEATVADRTVYRQVVIKLSNWETIATTLRANHHCEILFSRWSEYVGSHPIWMCDLRRRPVDTKKWYRAWAAMPLNNPDLNRDLSDHYVEALITGGRFTAQDREGWMATV